MAGALPTLDTITMPTKKVAKNTYLATAKFIAQVFPNPDTHICYYEARFISDLIRPTGYYFCGALPVMLQWAIGLPVQDREFQCMEVGCHQLNIDNTDNVTFVVRIGCRDQVYADGDPVKVSGEVGLTIYTAKQTV